MISTYQRNVHVHTKQYLIWYCISLEKCPGAYFLQGLQELSFKQYWAFNRGRRLFLIDTSPSSRSRKFKRKLVMHTEGETRG